MAVAPITLPSHASMLTGRYPIDHGVRDNAGSRFPEHLETIATLLKAEGYRTGAFVSGFPVDARFGLHRGFDVYDDDVGNVQGVGKTSFTINLGIALAELGKRVVILDAEGINQMDATGEEAMHSLCQRLEASGLTFFIARAKLPLMEVFERTGFVEHLGRDHFFRTRTSAIKAARAASLRRGFAIGRG